MRPKLFSVLSGLFLFLAALSAEAALSDISRIYHQVPDKADFEVCSGGGCAEIHHVALDNDEWQEISAIFADDDAPADAARERKHIADAIGAFETIVGAKTGTALDRAGTFNNSEYEGQLDCNDEAINSTTYMHLMRKYGLMQWHEIEDTRTRNFFFTGWPHSTAVMHEIASGKRYAVDSWFYDNGVSATIVPFELWKSGYIPEGSPLSNESGSTLSAHQRDE